MDLRGRDFGAVLGVPARASLAQEADSHEGGNGEREDQRYWCELSKAHGPNGRKQDDSPPFADAAGGVVERRLPPRYGESSLDRGGWRWSPTGRIAHPPTAVSAVQ
jgi:hypothetical protein